MRIGKRSAESLQRIGNLLRNSLRCGIHTCDLRNKSPTLFQTQLTSQPVDAWVVFTSFQRHSWELHPFSCWHSIRNAFYCPTRPRKSCKRSRRAGGYDTWLRPESRRGLKIRRHGNYPSVIVYSQSNRYIWPVTNL